MSFAAAAPHATPETPATEAGAAATPEVPRPRGAARREALLEAALRIVGEVGADAVTHRRVAEEAGLPLASTTYYFDSKEHLLTAALELAAERDTARLLDEVASLTGDRETGDREAGDPETGDLPTGDHGTAADPIDAAVAVIVDSCGAGLETNRGSLIATYALLLEAARRPALRDVAQRWTEIYVLTLGQLLERAGSSRPREDAELLLAAADGLLIAQLATGENADLRPRLRRLVETLVASS